MANPERVSDWEVYLFRQMREVGIDCIPQYAEGKYTLDFACLTNKGKLNIEVDGERYHRNWTGEHCRYDQIRNERLIGDGWDVMRFWVPEIRDDTERCVSKIKEWFRDH